MFRFGSTALMAVALMVVATGCAKDTDSVGEKAPALPETGTTTSAPVETPQPVHNERGLIVKELGETGGWGETDASSVSFSIDSITIDPPCHEYGTPPESGHTLLLAVRVATGADADAVQGTNAILNPFSFYEIGTDGITRNADAGSCTDHNASLPTEFGLNQKYAGTIEIIVPEASGVLALQTSAISDFGGWEWAY